MPEIVAAHLERVARELGEQVVRVILDGVDYAYDLGEHAEEIKPILAAALAACAREEARWWADGMHAAGGGEICKFCERIESLERAVGEKA